MFYEFRQDKSLLMKGALLALSALLLVGMSSADAQGLESEAETTHQEDNSQRVISVSGQGEITVEPEVAYLTLSVVSKDESPRTAQLENSELMNEVVAGLEDMGIDSEDITVGHYDIGQDSPRHPREELDREEDPEYRVQNQIEVIVRDLDQVSEVLDESVELGINQVDSVEFGVSDEEEYRLQALEHALEDAETKGERIATFYDRSLGEPLQVSEGRSYFRSMELDYAMEASESVSAQERIDPIPADPGEITVDTSVDVKYNMN